MSGDNFYKELLLLISNFIYVLLKSRVSKTPFYSHSESRTIFFPGLFFYVYYREPHTQKTLKASHHRPQTPKAYLISWANPLTFLQRAAENFLGMTKGGLEARTR